MSFISRSSTLAEGLALAERPVHEVAAMNMPEDSEEAALIAEMEALQTPSLLLSVQVIDKQLQHDLPPLEKQVHPLGTSGESGTEVGRNYFSLIVGFNRSRLKRRLWRRGSLCACFYINRSSLSVTMAGQAGNSNQFLSPLAFRPVQQHFAGDLPGQSTWTSTWRLYFRISVDAKEPSTRVCGWRWQSARGHSWPGFWPHDASACHSSSGWFCEWTCGAENTVPTSEGTTSSSLQRAWW